MVDICTENLTTNYLKEDIGHFRNLCQHTNMSLLENVLKTLRNKAEQIIHEVQEKVSLEKLKSILNDDLAETYDQQDGDIDPSYFIYLANCEYEALQEKFQIMPSVQFFTDVCKIILDSLR